jgi:hypothetical protein
VLDGQILGETRLDLWFDELLLGLLPYPSSLSSVLSFIVERGCEIFLGNVISVISMPYTIDYNVYFSVFLTVIDACSISTTGSYELITEFYVNYDITTTISSALLSRMMVLC